MAFPIIPKKRSGSAGNPASLQLGELGVNTYTGKLYLGADGGVSEIGIPVAAGTTATEYTGDGSTSAFLFAGYTGTDDGGYLVSVGGIDQPPSTYTISEANGGTISFASAPVAGELICIRAIVAGESGNAIKIQGRAVSATAPTDKQSLVWDAATSVWKPATGSGADIGGRAWSATETYTEGDLVATSQSETWICIQNANTGNDPATSPTWWDKMPANAVTLQGRPFSGEAPDQYMSLTWVTDAWMPSFTVELGGTPLVYPFEPTDGQVLGYDGAISKWKPVPASAGANASLLQGTAIAPEPNPNALEVLTWAQISTGGGDFAWRPRPLGGGNAPAEGQALVFNANAGWQPGDINASKLTDIPVSTTDPTTNQALVYSGTEWAPSDVNAIKIQGQTISSATPANGNLMRFDGTNWAPFDGLAIPSWNSGVSYSTGDRVWYDGKIWVSSSANSSNPPVIGSAYWAENLGGIGGSPSNQSYPSYWLRITTLVADGYIPIYV